MNREQHGRHEPDPNQTIRHRYPLPGQTGPGRQMPGSPTNPGNQMGHQAPPAQGPPEAPYTQRLPYTPDMLPDVQLYEAKPPRSGWWWVIVAGGLVLLIAAIAVAAILIVRSGNADAGTRATEILTVTPG